MLNMFVGVVVENFHRCREEQEKEERVRRAAKRALQMEKKRRSEWPQAPLGQCHFYHAADPSSRDVGVCAMLIVIVFRDARATVLHYLLKVAALRP